MTLPNAASPYRIGQWIGWWIADQWTNLRCDKVECPVCARWGEWVQASDIDYELRGYRVPVSIRHMAPGFAFGPGHWWLNTVPIDGKLLPFDGLEQACEAARKAVGSSPLHPVETCPKCAGKTA